MCRFLLVKTSKKDHRELLHAFAEMSRNSRALDGDWQGDGCGISWRDNGVWHTRKSLNPLWEDEEIIHTIPHTDMIMAHARSASFPAHKHVIAYNQPFVSGRYSFVFNGLLKGVTIPYPVQGAIGAQRVWNLLLMFLRDTNPADALEHLRDELVRHTRYIQACNIGLGDGQHIYALSFYGQNPEYYNLQSAVTEEGAIICSEPLLGYTFVPLAPGKVYVY